MSDGDEFDFKPSVLLVDGIDVQKLDKGMVTFETDTEFLHELQLDTQEYEPSDNEEECQFFGYKDIDDWKKESFGKLWSQMTPIDDKELMRKTVITASDSSLVESKATIKVRLSGFCQGSDEPFICTVDKKFMVLHVDNGGQLEGLDMALKTMRIGEYSRFLLSYKVMYGELGCPPLIPARANCLFNILVLGVVPAVEDRTDLNEEETTCFKGIYEKAVALHLTGKMFFTKKQYHLAIKSFKSAVRYLEVCRLRDEEEEKKLIKFLGKLYSNLAICYNMIKMPLKACCMCNSLHYLGLLNNNSKALFHNGRALMMIGEYGAALRKLKAAANLDKNCPNIKAELALLHEKWNLRIKNEETLRNNFELTFKEYRKSRNVETLSKEFTQSIENFCTCLLSEEDVVKAKLPDGLTEIESEEVRRVARKHQLFFDENHIVTYLSKIKLEDPVEEGIINNNE